MSALGQSSVVRASSITCDVAAAAAGTCRNEVVLAKGSTNLPASRVRQDRVVDSRRGTVHGEADRGTDGQTQPASGEVKASATDGSDQSPARVTAQETLVPTERAVT
jgi:hypothetical protein